MDEGTRNQLEFFIRNNIPIMEYNKEHAYITDIKPFEEMAMTTIQTNEINSLEAPRLWIKSLEPRRNPYDIFTCMIPAGKYPLKVLVIQEKWKKRLDIKILSDPDTIDQINGMKYAEDPDIDTEIERIGGNLSIHKLANEEYKDWILYNKHFSNLQKLSERTEEKMNEIHDLVMEKRNKMSELELAIADSIKIEFKSGIKINTKQIAKKYQVTFNTVWYKYYQYREEELMYTLRKYDKVLNKIGD